MTSIKEQLYRACLEFVRTKEDNILNTIRSHKEALSSETKSSAGDKHETGRAMLQLEMEKASQQLEVVHAMKAVLQRMDVSKKSDAVSLGSIIATNFGNYFLAISAGELNIEGEKYYAVSAGSPIGKLLLGKKAGGSIIFQNKIEIKEIF